MNVKKVSFSFLFFIVLAAIVFSFIFFQNQQRIASISNFEECASAGYPVMDSYPARCMTPDKRSFTQELTEEEKQKLIPRIIK